MSNTLSPALLAQLYGQDSNDPFLMLLTISHASFTTLRLVNNTEDIVSNGNTFTAFPFRVNLSVDDGESSREVGIEFDNVSLQLIDEIRTVTTPMAVKLEMVLASDPDFIQIEVNDLQIRNITYNKQTVTAKLIMDDFLSTELTSEKYTPTLYPGLF